VERLASGLRDRGIPVEIVTTDPAASVSSVEVREGIPVRRFPTVRGDRLFYPSPQLARWLRHAVDGYALLHTHNLHTLVPLAGSWAAHGAKVPVVLTAHWHGGGHTPVRRVLHVPYRPVAGRVVRGAAAIIGNSEAEAALLRRDFGKSLPITVIAEGIELPSATGNGSAMGNGSAPGVAEGGPGVAAGAADPDGRTGWTTILAVGRLEAYKGVAQAVRAMPFLPPTYRLVVVGQGPDRDAIERAATDAGVADRVVLRGRVPDEELQAWYRQASVFVSLSTHESFGLAVLEAAAGGVPVVASDIPAHRETTAFVPPGRITLVSGATGAAEVAASIETALAQGRAMDTTGWQLPSWDDLVERTVAVYQRVLERG